MKILITGHKGFIGQHMCASLVNNGHDVDGYEWGDAYPNVKLYDWIMHMGAISSTAERNVEKVMDQNYDFSVKLYDDALKYNVNFQFSSSASVYGLNSVFSEDSPVDPKTPYAWSKYMFERYILKHTPSTSTAQVFRYFNVFGPEKEDHKGDQSSPHFKFKKQSEELNHVKVFKNSQNYLRDFIHVNEVVQIQQKFLHIKDGGIFNIGSGKAQSFLEVAKLYSNNIVEVEMPESIRSSYQTYTCADMKKTRNILKKALV